VKQESPDRTHNRSTILVVDDERGPRESLRMILEPVHRVIQAVSGSDALERLRCEEVDLVTLDLNMPGVRGEELMRTIRADHPETGIIVVTGCGSVESAAEGVRLGICDYLQKPFDVVHVSSSVARALAQRRARTRLLGFLQNLGELVGRDRDLEAIMGDVRQSQKIRGQLGALFATASAGEPEQQGPRPEEFLEVLAETLESRDPLFLGHARRVATYAGLVGERFQLSVRDREELRLAAFLHDVGRVAVPSDLLVRPGALTAAEQEIVREHPCIGERLLRPLHIPTAVSAAVRHHHERWDGSGYPDELVGDDIPLAARIIAVADTYDAMISQRPYRSALDRRMAALELRRYAGNQFDPDVVKEFVATLEACTFDVGPDFFANVVFGPRAAPLASEVPA
jgi:putative two-component system response regulator